MKRPESRPPTGTAEFDTLIIGSGMAGGSLAGELLARGHRDLAVLSTGDRGRYPGAGPAADTLSPWTSSNANYQPMPGTEGRIGGRSMSWYGVALPIGTDALAAWPSSTIRELPGAYRHVIRYLESWKGSRLDASGCETEDLVRRQVGSGDGGFRVVPTAAYWSVRDGHRVWTAYSPTRALLDDPARSRELTLLDGHRVLWIDPGADAGMVVTAEPSGGGEKLLIRARSVVLAAGTLENTRLYAQALHRATGHRVTTWPRLATKIKHGILTRPAAWMTKGLQAQDMVYLVSEQPGRRGNLFLEIRPDLGGEPYLDLWWLGEQSQGETASIRFTPDSPIWRGLVECDLGPGDLALTQERDRYANALLADWGCPPAAPNSPFLASNAEAKSALVADPAGRPVRYRNRLGLSDHESGTLALGEHLGPDFASSAVPGLYVAGPSTFPRSGAANPSLTILALSHLRAQMVSPPAGFRRSAMESARHREPVS